MGVYLNWHYETNVDENYLQKIIPTSKIRKPLGKILVGGTFCYLRKELD
jgi:hypothetical protein